MIKFAILLFQFLFGIDSQTIPQDQRWILSWNDEFNNNEIDNQFWTKIYRHEPEWAQLMTSDSALYDFRDGNLILKGMKNNFLPDDEAPYLTGGLWSWNKKAFGFGRIEICAKFSASTGF